jgi:hypothetical protein
MDINECTRIFNEIGHECGNTFQLTCGSYLFDGFNYVICSENKPKQDNLFELSKNATKVLEVGTYMGHSLLIMLLANPSLDITCIDIDRTYTPKAIRVLRRNFPLAKITFILGDSYESLSNIDIKEKFDLIHIDALHTAESVKRDYELCIQHIMPVTTFVFDDYVCFPDLIDSFANEKSPHYTISDYTIAKGLNAYFKVYTL